MSATPSVFDKPLDGDINDVAEGLAILVDGDTAPRAISSGQYLFIKNHTTLATGGYHASSAIASGATISSSNVTVDADGIANSLNSSVTALNSKLNVVITSLGTGITKFVYGKIIIIDFQGASIPADGVDTGETIYGSFFASVSVVNSVFTLIRNLSSKIVVRNGEAATGVYGTWWGIIS